jgi:hypothetical protein
VALIVSILGTLTALICAGLLLRAFAVGRQRLLLWCGLCFIGLTVSNALLVYDIAEPALDLHVVRLATAAAALLLMVYGLVWEADRR